MGQGDGLGRGGVPKGPNDETLFRHLCPRLEMRLRSVFLLFLFIISLEIIEFFYIKIYLAL